MALGTTIKQRLDDLRPKRENCGFAMAIDIDVGNVISKKPFGHRSGLFCGHVHPLIPRLGYCAINTGKIAVARKLEVCPGAFEVAGDTHGIVPTGVAGRELTGLCLNFSMSGRIQAIDDHKLTGIRRRNAG
jgi:hypothetical protein